LDQRSFKVIDVGTWYLLDSARCTLIFSMGAAMLSRVS